MNYFRQSTSVFQLFLLLTCFTTFAIGSVAVANGQAQSAANDEQTAPEEVTLETKDKVQLVCTYFAPNKPAGAKEEEATTVSYTHLRAHETDSYLVCRLLLEKKK